MREERRSLSFVAAVDVGAWTGDGFSVAWASALAAIAKVLSSSVFGVDREHELAIKVVKSKVPIIDIVLIRKQRLRQKSARGTVNVGIGPKV